MWFMPSRVLTTFSPSAECKLRRASVFSRQGTREDDVDSRRMECGADMFAAGLSEGNPVRDLGKSIGCEGEMAVRRVSLGVVVAMFMVMVYWQGLIACSTLF